MTPDGSKATQTSREESIRLIAADIAVTPFFAVQ
jgi:hypothetical protein